MKLSNLFWTGNKMSWLAFDGIHFPKMDNDLSGSFLCSGGVWLVRRLLLKLKRTKDILEIFLVNFGNSTEYNADELRFIGYSECENFDFNDA